MFRPSPSIISLFIFLSAFSSGCGGERRITPRPEMPARFLWAWERPEDLRFLDAREFGVAYLAQTLVLQRGEVLFRPRRQPLEINADVYLVAVTRIETVKQTERRPDLSDEQIEETVALVKKTLARPQVRALQLDFDAVVSERGFYRRLVERLRAEIPAETPLSATALASWCAGDDWLGELAVDEAVPMVFEMGADAERVRSYLARGNDWREPLCRASYGLSVDEPLAVDFKPQRRFYYFNSASLSPGDLEKIARR